MRCIICGILIDSIDEAIEAGWIPYFYEGDQQHEPTCGECSETLLQVDENGEMEVKEEYRDNKTEAQTGRFSRQIRKRKIER